MAGVAIRTVGERTGCASRSLPLRKATSRRRSSTASSHHTGAERPATSPCWSHRRPWSACRLSTSILRYHPTHATATGAPSDTRSWTFIVPFVPAFATAAAASDGTDLTNMNNQPPAQQWFSSIEDPAWDSPGPLASTAQSQEQPYSLDRASLLRLNLPPMLPCGSTRWRCA